MYQKAIDSFATQTALTSYPYRLVKLAGTDGDLALCGAGERPIGVLGKLGEIPTISSGDKKPASVHKGNKVEVDVGATAISGGGVALASDANGEVVPAIDGDEIVGYSTVAASANTRTVMVPCASGVYSTPAAEGSVPAASVATLNATPVEMIGAPGAGYYLEVDSIEWFLDYGSSAYAGNGAGEDLVARYTDGSGAVAVDAVDESGFADATSDQRRVVKGVSVTPVVNAALVAHILVGEWGGAGDSPIQYRVNYAIRRALT